jgi:hypothetical protein
VTAEPSECGLCQSGRADSVFLGYLTGASSRHKACNQENKREQYRNYYKLIEENQSKINTCVFQAGEDVNTKE